MSKTIPGNITSFAEAKESRLFAYNKEHYGNTIRTSRQKKGWTQQYLDNHAGVSKNHVTNWEAGRARPDLNLIPVLCNVLEISLSSFFGTTEARDALTKDESQVLNRYRRLGDRDRLVIKATMDKMLDLSATDLLEYCRTTFMPIMHNYQQAAAGTATLLDEGTEQYQTYVRHNRVAEHADEIVTVNGSSMEPMFHDGQDVYVEHTTELAPGEIGLFVVNGEGYIKEWAKDRLHSLNPEYKDIILNENDAMRCIGRILGTVDPADYPTEEEAAVLQELQQESGEQA